VEEDVRVNNIPTWLVVIGWVVPPVLSFFLGRGTALQQELYKRQTAALDEMREKMRKLREGIGGWVWMWKALSIVRPPGILSALWRS
jgi:hypothetical protein